MRREGVEHGSQHFVSLISITRFGTIGYGQALARAAVHDTAREREISLQFVTKIGPRVLALRRGFRVSNIFAKLQVADRTQAIMRPRDAGLR
jgi:hypothetical protein